MARNLADMTSTNLPERDLLPAWNFAWYSGRRLHFRQLLLADSVHFNGRLARFYGVDLPPDAPFQKVKLNPNDRAAS